jgi:hypothetical protein
MYLRGIPLKYTYILFCTKVSIFSFTVESWKAGRKEWKMLKHQKVELGSLIGRIKCSESRISKRGNR